MKSKIRFLFLSWKSYSPGYSWDPYTTHRLQSGAFHWSRLLFHPRRDWTAGGSEILPASISFQSFELSDEATCMPLDRDVEWKTRTAQGITFNSYKMLPKNIFCQSVSTSHLTGWHWPVQNLIAPGSNDTFCIMISRDQLVSKRL